ncbi:hypothetical protein ACFL3G_02285 [Planctomycetota bacterium]
MKTAAIRTDSTDLLLNRPYGRTWSEQESFNFCWAEYCRRKAIGFNITVLPISAETAFQQPQNTIKYEEENISTILQSVRAEPEISQKNLDAIKFLDQWMSEPDDLGEKFWKEFCEDLEKNRFTI